MAFSSPNSQSPSKYRPIEGFMLSVANQNQQNCTDTRANCSCNRESFFVIFFQGRSTLLLHQNYRNFQYQVHGPCLAHKGVASSWYWPSQTQKRKDDSWFEEWLACFKENSASPRSEVLPPGKPWETLGRLDILPSSWLSGRPPSNLRDWKEGTRTNIRTEWPQHSRYLPCDRTFLQSKPKERCSPVFLP